MKRFNVKILLYLLFSSFLSLWSFINAWSYPLKQITLSNCTDSCTIDLPIISNASYYSYKNSWIYRKVYTMLRLSTYYWGWDIWAWTHQWVDMACIIWTPVYATHEWTVIVAWEKWNRWHTITIQHEWDWKIYYSVYAHLSSIDVHVWDYVTEWEKIWEVWDSGNTTGPHLHFQIDVNERSSHPYFPSGCWKSIVEKVNAWICISDVRKNTIDPIVFLEQTTKLSLSSQISNTEELYINNYDLNISWFEWWFLEQNSFTNFTIHNNSSNSKLLLSPISIVVDSWYISSSITSIKSITSERDIFIKTKDSSWFSIIEIKYWNKTIKRIPVIIWTSEEIQKRKSNKKLLNSLSKLWINNL